MASPARANATHVERHRSERTHFMVKVVISGYCARKPFEEETFTISVNAHGALLALTTDVALGQRVVLSNPQNWDEREARVSRLAKLHGQCT